MVVAEGETQREDLAKSIQIMTDINLLGIVLNKSRDVLGNTYY
jgi:Mrp family chromosome partitioning ATPase